MGKLLSIFAYSFVFLNTSIFAQGYFPLQKGNLWQYSEIPYPIETSQVLGDTILPNGHTYAVCSGIGLPGNFLRQAGAKIYSVDSQGNEYVIFDFTANVSDVVGVNGLDTIRLVEKGFHSGFNQNYWVFTSGYGELILTSWNVIDSLGICYMIFEPGVQYTLRGARINGIVRYGTITSVSQEPAMLPVGISLLQNYPNPFNPSTEIDLILSNSAYVSLRIMNTLGQEIATLYQGKLTVGNHSFTWNASNVSAGIYFCRLEANRSVLTKKLVLIK
jgi:hypothetical protein